MNCLSSTGPVNHERESANSSFPTHSFGRTSAGYPTPQMNPLSVIDASGHVRDSYRGANCCTSPQRTHNDRRPSVSTHPASRSLSTLDFAQRSDGARGQAKLTSPCASCHRLSATDSDRRRKRSWPHGPPSLTVWFDEPPEQFRRSRLRIHLIRASKPQTSQSVANRAQSGQERRLASCWLRPTRVERLDGSDRAPEWLL